MLALCVYASLCTYTGYTASSKKKNSTLSRGSELGYIPLTGESTHDAHDQRLCSYPLLNFTLWGEEMLNYALAE